jgi:hypothetical protein
LLLTPCPPAPLPSHVSASLQIRVVVDSVVTGAVSKVYSEGTVVGGRNGVASPLSLFRVASASTRTLDVTVTSMPARGSAGAPTVQHLLLDVVTAVLNVEVGVGEEPFCRRLRACTVACST